MKIMEQSLPNLLSEVLASSFFVLKAYCSFTKVFNKKLFTCTKARPSWWFGFGMEDLSDSWKIFRKCLDLNLHHFFWEKQRPSSEDVVNSLCYWKLFSTPGKSPNVTGNQDFSGVRRLNTTGFPFLWAWIWVGWFCNSICGEMPKRWRSQSHYQKCKKADERRVGTRSQAPFSAPKVWRCWKGLNIVHPRKD